MRDQRIGDQPDIGDRHELPQVVAGDLHRGVERVGRRGKQERVAVRSGGGHGGNRKLAARARPRLDHHRLAPHLLQMLRDDAGEDIRARPDDDLDRMVGETLRVRRVSPGGGKSRRKRNDQSDEASGSHRLTSLRPGSRCPVSAIMMDDGVR